MIDLTLSDLFFNSKEVEAIDYNKDNLKSEVAKVASEWLEKYPAFKTQATSEDLVNDFLRRL